MVRRPRLRHPEGRKTVLKSILSEPHYLRGNSENLQDCREDPRGLDGTFLFSDDAVDRRHHVNGQHTLEDAGFDGCPRRQRLVLHGLPIEQQVQTTCYRRRVSSLMVGRRCPHP
jgi:hypothetical protein